MELGPGAAHLDKFEGRLVVVVEKPIAKLAVAVAVDDLEGLLADPLNGLDSGAAGSGEAPVRPVPVARSSSRAIRRTPLPCRRGSRALEGLTRFPGLSFPSRSLHIPLPVGLCAMVHRLSRQILLANQHLTREVADTRGLRAFQIA